MKEFAYEWFNTMIDPESPYTLADAAADLDNMRSCEFVLPEDITPESLHAAMCEVIEEYKRINE
jgi:hypothetical protein